MARRTKDFCTLLKEGVKDEKSADGYYQRLGEALVDKAYENHPDRMAQLAARNDLDIINSLREDEQHHNQALTAMHNRRCT